MANVLPETPDVLNSFAPETDPTAPRFAGYSTPAPLESDIPFIIHHSPVPLAPVRAARGGARRVLTVLLAGSASWAAYAYGARHPLDLDAIASRLASPIHKAITVPPPPPVKPLRLDPEPGDSPLASNNAGISSGARPTADTRSNASSATVGEVAETTTARRENTGTSGTLVNPALNVSGVWRLDTQTEASDSSLEGLTLHYDVTLAQAGDRVTGVGMKVGDAGQGTGPGARTPVSMSGTIAGDRLTLNVVESGSDPEARGKIVLLVNGAGTMRGRFSSNAIPASGHVEGRRVSSSAMGDGPRPMGEGLRSMVEGR